MFRKIFKFLVGLLAFVGLIVILGLGSAVFTLKSRVAETVSVPDKAIVFIDLTDNFPEEHKARFLISGSSVSFRELLGGIEKARSDPRVVALVAKGGSGSLGMAQAEEVRKAILSFEQAGKVALYYADDLGSGWNGSTEYYLATAFDKIVLHPSAGVGATGYAIEMPYLADTLDRLGVKPEFEQRYEFKGGADPYTQNAITEPVKETMTALLSGWRNALTRAMAERRGLSPEKAKGIIDAGPYSSEEALDLNLVDQLAYRDGFDRMVDELIDPEALYIDLSDYVAASRKMFDDRARVAVVYGIGPIVSVASDSFSGDETFDPERVIGSMEELIDDPDIQAVVLRIDSPGGEYGPSDSLWHTVSRLRAADKYVVVSMGNIAASGGYFAAAGANRIFADATTVTGSIGVYAGKFSTIDLWKKLGVNWAGLKAGENADFWSFIEPMTPAQQARFSALIDEAYDDFSTKVAMARGMSPNQIDKVARGRIWIGKDALSAGLVDSIGGLSDAVRVAARTVGAEPPSLLDVAVYPKPRTLADEITDMISSFRNEGLVGALSHSFARMMDKAGGNLRNGIFESGGPKAVLPPMKIVW